MRPAIVLACVVAAFPVWAQDDRPPAVVEAAARAGDQSIPPAPDEIAFTDSLRVTTPGNTYLALATPTHSWTIFANEFLFFLREAGAGGSRDAFVIQSGAPSSSLWIDAGGQVGLGTLEPEGRLHVLSSDAGTANARVVVEEASATAAARNMLRIVNQGPSTFRFENSVTGAFYGFGSLGSGNFFIGSSAGQPLAFTMTPGGNVTLTGTLTQMSDRNAKHDVVPVDAEALLQRALALPLSTWSYNGDEARHVGPMAQDFAAAFRLGADDKHVAPSDVAGVSLAAVQALSRKLEQTQAQTERKLEQKDAEIAELARGLAALRALLSERRP